jgi:hypothetical protein
VAWTGCPKGTALNAPVLEAAVNSVTRPTSTSSGVRVVLLHCYTSHGVVFLCAEAFPRLGLDGREEISIDTFHLAAGPSLWSQLTRVVAISYIPRPPGIVLATTDKYRNNSFELRVFFPSFTIPFEASSSFPPAAL